MANRDYKTDRAMEAKFGKPDWSRSFIKDGVKYTPLGKHNNIWRIDPDLQKATGG